MTAPDTDAAVQSVGRHAAAEETVPNVTAENPVDTTASPTVAPTEESTAGTTTETATHQAAEKRYTRTGIIVQVPLGSFFSRDDLTQRKERAKRTVASIVRDVCGIDVTVGLARPLMYVNNEDTAKPGTLDTFSAAGLIVFFENVTASELREYESRMRDAMGGTAPKYPILTGPEFKDFPTVDVFLPDRKFLEGAGTASSNVNKAVDDLASGTAQTASTAGSAGPATQKSASEYKDVSDFDLI